MPKQTLGQRIAQARRELAVRLRRDVSASNVAEALGVAPATVYRWESDEKVPKDDSLLSLAKYLGVSPAYLRYGVTEASKPATIIEATQEIVPRTKRPSKRDVG